MNGPIRLGLDFDGVLAYNPFRVVRSPIAYVKRNILGIKKLSFFYPKSKWQQLFWILLHESSVFPAKGTHLLRKLVAENHVEAHLITARYSFLDDHLLHWLRKYKLETLFASVNLNKNDLQPHLFKEQMVKKYKLDIFIEDNLDIVLHLRKKKRTHVYWIYNVLDRFYPYPFKYPHLEEALKDIIKGSDRVAK